MRPIYLLVVAAARAWDFPWSSTDEGWAPAEDKTAESDPFWVDRAPCEADTRPPRNEKRGRALTGNLLRNGDARERTMDGWSVVNGGDGWSRSRAARAARPDLTRLYPGARPSRSTPSPRKARRPAEV